MKITESEILDALRAAMQSSETGEGATIRELSEATGWFDGKVREMLRPFVTNGQVACARGKRLSLDGRMATVPVYSWVKKKGA